jgi:hypothetical protein
MRDGLGGGEGAVATRPERRPRTKTEGEAARCRPVFPFGMGSKAANRSLPTTASDLVVSSPRFLPFTLNHYTWSASPAAMAGVLRRNRPLSFRSFRITNRPAEVLAGHSERGHRLVHPPIFRERGRLADLPRVVVPVRRVLMLQDSVGEFAWLYPVRASLANRETRVLPCGTPASHAASRERFIAVAVITCCRCAFASPM